MEWRNAWPMVEGQHNIPGPPEGNLVLIQTNGPARQALRVRVTIP